MRPSWTALSLGVGIVVCCAFTIGLTWAPCYSQVCPEEYHPLATRVHIVTSYAVLAITLSALLLRAYDPKLRSISQVHLTPRELPILRKRISIGGLLLAIWIVGAVLATTGFWFKPLLTYWTARFRAVGWTASTSTLVLTGIFAHHADILLGLLLIPVGRNSLLGQTCNLQQHTLLFAHKLLAYLTVLSVLAHMITYYTFVADYVAVPWTGGNARKKAAVDVENPNISYRQLADRGAYFGVSLFTGTLSFTLMIVIVISSVPVLRRRKYNTFYYIHVIFSCLVFVGTCIHSSTNFYFLLPGLFLWVVDWGWRLFRGEYSLLKSVEGTIENASNGWVRITLPAKAHDLAPKLSGEMDGEAGESTHHLPHPLRTYYLYIPSVSRLQIHAFSTVTTGATGTGPVILFQRTSIEGKGERKQKRMKKKQWTWKVGNGAGSSSGDKSPTNDRLRIRVEGPYCPPDRDFGTADKIICVVGGTGITGALSLAQWFLAARVQSSRATMTVVWSVRNGLLALLAEWQNLLERSADTDGKLRLRLHVSSENGRLDVDSAIRAELAGTCEEGGSKAWIYISGPRGLLVAAEDVCCDIEAELRTAKKSGAVSGLAVDAMSYHVAKWEV